MSAYGTKREFGEGHFQVGNPTHCRPPSPSVGLLPDGRPDSEGSRTSIVDPTETEILPCSIGPICLKGADAGQGALEITSDTVLVKSNACSHVHL